MNVEEMAQNNLILKIQTGSLLYGTNTESSDKDYVGVFIPDKDYVMGLHTVEQVDLRTNPSESGRRNTGADTDTVLYSLPKFIKLALNNNPNIIELFFAPQKDILWETRFGGELLMNVDLFLSKKVKHTFLGYAFEQKRKILTKNPIGSRREYIEKFGYDVKFASHLIRLLTEGVELLSTSKLQLPLANGDYLRDIKLGKYSLEHVLAEATRYEALVEQAYADSTLQHTANFNAINAFQIDMLERFWQQQEDETFYNATKKHGW